MTILSRVSGYTTVSATPTSLAYYYEANDDHRAFYDLLRIYYLNNGMYDELRSALSVVNMAEEALKPLRNPSSRVVEFYAAKVWPGTLPEALPIEADNQALAPLIEQVWKWSNWSVNKQVFVRWLALYGDVFLKVSTGGKPRVFHQVIDPRFVPDFAEDERGFLTYFRADVPQVEREGDETSTVTYTEVWDKGENRFRTWVHEKGHGADLGALGDPTMDAEIQAFGFDFVPVVHAKQRDIGEDRGDGAFAHVIDKIDEANRLATRLHQMLFRNNRNTWVLKANMVDPSGRPVPAPKLNTDGSDQLAVGDNTVLRLPGNSELQSMVPDIRYQDALAVLNAHLLELEQDLPELAYYRLKNKSGEISGRAVRMLLTDAIDRVLEARGNAEAALIQANEMALTIGGVNRLPGFQDAGRFEAGDFAHTFAERDVIPMDQHEKAETFNLYRQGGMAMTTAMRLAGYSEDEIIQAQADLQLEQAQAQSSLATALLEQQRRFDQGAGQI